MMTLHFPGKWENLRKDNRWPSWRRHRRSRGALRAAAHRCSGEYPHRAVERHQAG
jgi:hypothetical protein